MIDRLAAYGATSRRRPDHLRRAAAHAPADGAGDQGPGHRPLRVDRLHLGQRRARRPREVRGVRPGRPRLRRAQDRGRRRRHRPGAARVGPRARPRARPASTRPRACSRTWPPFDEVLDPINRVFLPRADIATDTLVAGLQDMGWEVDDVTAYRTVRAAPPAAPIREAIKTGRYDAVVFTSSSTVRNLVGIAGKPHAVHRRRLHRPGHGQDRRGARPAGRRPRARGLGRRARRLARRLRHGPRARGRRGRRDRRATRARARPSGADRKAHRADGVPDASGRGGCGRPRRSGGWWPRPGCTRATWCCRCSSARAPTEPVPIELDARRRPAHRWTRWSQVADEAVAAGLGGIMVFGVPLDHGRARARARTTPTASSTSRCGPCATPSATTSCVMADLCLDEFTDHGHCGVLDAAAASTTTRRWSATARWPLAQAAAGAHVVGPSGMMDGQVAHIRAALDDAGHQDVVILAYAAKYASGFYGPFREAVESTLRGRPGDLPAGPGQRHGVAARAAARHRRGRRHRHGQAGAALPRHPRGRGGRVRRCRSRPTRCRGSTPRSRRPPPRAGSTATAW